MNKKQSTILISILALITVIVVVVWLVLLPNRTLIEGVKQQSEDQNIDRAVNLNKELDNLDPFDRYFNKFLSKDISKELDIEGDLLYVDSGDLWRADLDGKNRIKLIDSGNVFAGELSPSKRQIIYLLEVEKRETITNYDGTTEEITVYVGNLMLADAQGSNSVLVKEDVGRFGWITDDVFWYETTSLKQVFAWGYIGSGSIWLFDTNKGKAEKFVDENIDEKSSRIILSPNWSPDKQKLMFVGYNDLGLVLKIADRKTKKVREVFDLPYVGGDRGGPPPVPNFYWGPNSKSIYTVFTPLIYGDKKSTYKSGYLYVLRIPIDGSGITNIMPPVVSYGSNNEIYPGVVFSRDFSELVYLRYNENDVKDMRADEWVYQGVISEDTPLVLVKYDVKKQTETVILDNINNFFEGGNFRYMKSGLTFYDGDVLPLIIKYNKFTEDYLQGGSGAVSYIDFIKIIKINLTTGGVESVFKFPSDRYFSLSNIEYFQESDTLIFIGRRPEKEDRLYVLVNNKLGSVIENIENAFFNLR